jgi:hypothetical protein
MTATTAAWTVMTEHSGSTRGSWCHVPSGRAAARRYGARSCAGSATESEKSSSHPDPQINFVPDLAIQTFSTGLQTRLAHIQDDIRAAGKTARVGFVDTLSAMEGRQGLLLIEKRNGFVGGFEFEIHPTNAGHTVIAKAFEKVWKSMNERSPGARTSAVEVLDGHRVTTVHGAQEALLAPAEEQR